MSAASDASPDRVELRKEWRYVAGVFAGSGVGYLGTAGAPVIVAALIVAGLGTEEAGDLGTIELMTLAATSTLVMPLVTRFSHRRIMVFGTMMAVVGLAISVASEGFAAMALGRLLTGGGSGFAISGANAAVAARGDAERVFALIWTLGGAITAALAFGLPFVTADGNYPMGFGVLLVLCLAGLPLMFWVPHSRELVPEPIESAPDGTAIARPAAPSGSIFTPVALLGLAGIFVYSMAETALWNFGYYLPVEAGVPEELVGAILSSTVLMGLAGGALAAWLGTSRGRLMPIVIGSLVSVAGRWLFIQSSTPEMVFLAGLLWGLGFYFVTPYQVGLLAQLDRTGRLAVAAGAAGNLGYGIGPAVAGRVLESFDPSAFLYVVVGGTALSLALLLPLTLQVERGDRGRTH
ncbi:MAG: MFS transporter [Deltaproteobacteria bacterium]|nr:MFS transporter [Deltaproteobacteria bacterium]